MMGSMFRSRYTGYNLTVMPTRKYPSPIQMDDSCNDESFVMTGIKIQKLEKNESLASINSKPTNQNKCSFIIHHESRFKVIWDWMVLVLVIFTAIQIPFYAAFLYERSYIILEVAELGQVETMLILSAIVDCMFILDIFINFRTTYVQSSSDECITDPRKLAVHYLKTWFIIDLLAAIPFDWIMHNNSDSGSTPTLIGLLKSARLLRLFRVARKLDRYSEYGIAVLFLLMSLFTLISHWLACVWNGIAILEEGNTNSWVHKMDVLLNGPMTNNSTKIRMTPAQRYIAALYFIVSSLTSVGFGNVAATTEAEQVFTVIIMLLGALMYACIFGNMVAIVQRLYSKASSFHTHMNMIREFLKFYKIPEELRLSINNYVRREWTVSQGVDVETVLRRFPDCIQADLTYELYQGVFHNVRPFKSATVSCMRALALKFKTMTLQGNNYPIRQGEEINSLYILGKGSLEVLIDGDLEYIVAQYSMFGYDFVKQPVLPKSKANVRASCLVEIHYIHKDEMNEILRLYPKFAKSFRETFKMSYDLNDESEEGYFKATPKKDSKVHVTAIAKMALSMPIMAQWKKRKTSKNKKEYEENDSHVNGMLKSLSCDDIEMNSKRSSWMVGCTSNEDNHLNPNTRPHSPYSRAHSPYSPCRNKAYHSTTALPACNKDVVYLNYEKLNHRMNNLANELHELHEEFDEKILLILNLLKDIKDRQGEVSSKIKPHETFCETGRTVRDVLKREMHPNVNSEERTDEYLSISIDDITNKCHRSTEF